MSRFTRRPRLLAVISAFLAVAVLGGAGVVLAATVKSGKAVTAVKTVTEAGIAGISTSAWTDIAGMSTSITVPSYQKALLIITFSAQSYCADGNGSPTTLCFVRVLVDGTEAPPGQVIFRSAADGNAARGTNSMQFVAGPLNAGSHTVKVQGYVDQPVSQFSFQDRTLTVLRSQV